MNKFYKTAGNTDRCDDITLVITDDCNLRCSYYYENNESSNIMPVKMVKKIINSFFDKYEQKYNSVNFDFI